MHDKIQLAESYRMNTVHSRGKPLHRRKRIKNCYFRDGGSHCIESRGSPGDL